MIPEDLMRKYKYGYVHSCEILNEAFVKDLIKENQELKVQINKAIENSNKLLKFINQNFMSNDGFKQFSFKDLLKIKGYCDESLEMLIGMI